MASKLASQPPPSEICVLSYPAPSVMLITLNNPSAMNSLNYESSWEIDAILHWFDAEPSLAVAVITGTGKAFCAGQNLAEQGMIFEMQEMKQRGEEVDEEALDRRIQTLPPSGFAGISRRAGKKPIVAAVNGYALGGGFELCMGCDMVVVSPKATFALPEAQRGLYAAAGGLSRLARLTSMTIASEVALTGRVLTAQEAVSYGIANRLSKTHESLVDEAVEMAARVALASPDAIIVTRAGLRQSWEEGSVERATQNLEHIYMQRMRDGENVRIGLKAFAARKKPQWVPSKL